MFTATILIAAGLTLYQAKAEKMKEINVDIGKNIAIIASNNGAFRFGVESHWGLKIYELVDIPIDFNVSFVRPGYEINTKPIFSLTMYADSESRNNEAVEKLVFQFSRHAAKSHDEARLLIGGLLEQFSQGKWHRYIRKTCPAVSGKSAYLNINQQIDSSCPLDPAYQIPIEDWIELAAQTQHYAWIGSGVLAELSVHFDDDARGITYSINLEFTDFATYTRRATEEHIRRLAKGDKNGWRSTELYERELATTMSELEKLEAAALSRGDSLVTRHEN
jgi:hypothetical protein